MHCDICCQDLVGLSYRSGFMQKIWHINYKIHEECSIDQDFNFEIIAK